MTSNARIYLTTVLLVLIFSAPYHYKTARARLNAKCECCGLPIHGLAGKAQIAAAFLGGWLLHGVVWFVTIPYGFWILFKKSSP